MNRATAAIKRLWGLRNSEVRSVRARWWIVVATITALLLFRDSILEITLVLWYIGNGVLGAVSFGWMLFHPRALGRSSNTAITWSRWLTAVSVFSIYVVVSGGSHTVTPGNFLLLLLAFAPIIFICFLMFSLFGSSLGAFVRRRHSDVEQSAIAAVVGWWIAVILAFVWVVLQEAFHLPASIVAPMIVGTPALTILFASLLRRVYLGETREPLRLVDSALRHLVIRVGPPKNARTFDLRGVTIGLLSAAVVLWLARPIVAPAQQNVLAAMFKLRWQLYQYLQNFDMKRSRVVFVRFDTTATAAAMTQSSESAQEAAIIRRLTQDKAGVVVLSAPTIDPRLAELGDTSTAAVKRTLRDLPDLTSAVTQNGRVVLVLTPEQRRSAALTPLMTAVAGVSQFGEEPAGPALLPSIPLKWNADQLPPSPLMVVALQKGAVARVTVRKVGTAVQTVNGIPVSTALSDRVVVDLSTNGHFHGGSTPTFALSALLDGTAPLPESLRTSETPGIDRYLAKKVVIIEPLIHGDIDTPLGLMPRFAALASAINALLFGEEIRHGNSTAALLWTLTLGVLIGSQCVGRDPLQASWRVAVLMLLNFGYTVTIFLVMDVWADPVMPLVTATVAFLLVTQFTFDVERNERERNRALFSRFIAREFVDELLQSSSRTLALGGEKRTVCVLFADVRNFTGFAESHEPEQVIEIMNIYLTALTDALDAYGGLLDKYTGDGLMAFFEIKGDVRTELVRSVSAALAMRDAAIAISDRLRAAGKHALDVGIGIHYGDAIVGLVGNEQRQINYTALGHTVVVSARLQSLAEGGDVVVSEPIFAEVKDCFVFESMPPVYVKGITAEQRPYRVSRRATQASDRNS